MVVKGKLFLMHNAKHSMTNTSSTTVIPILIRLWRHISVRRRRQFGFLLILMIVASFAEVLSIGAVVPFLGVLTAPDKLLAYPAIQPLLQWFGISSSRQLLLYLTIAFGTASIVAGALRLILLWAQTRLSHAIGSDLSMEVYRRTLYQPYRVHIARNSSEVVAGISTKVSTVVYYLIWPVLLILSSALILITIVTAMFSVEPVIAFIAFAGFGGIYLIVILASKKNLARYSVRISREQNQVLKALTEGLGGIRDVLIDGTQAAFCKIYNDADQPLRRAQANVLMWGSAPRAGVEALGMVFIAVLAYYLAGRDSSFAATIPMLGAFALGAQRLLPVLQQGYASYTSILGGLASVKDTLDLLDQPLPHHADEDAVIPMPFNRGIRLEQLCFSYSGEQPWVLNDVCLTIEKGSRVGFIGTTGTGKSTLLDILMGLLGPTRGRLVIDGQTVDESNCRAWQKRIAHVPQAIFLADLSILENIAFGVPIDKIDFARAAEAAQKAQIAQTIESWPTGYMTMVGERGVRLSGGQRQRIGIARALYKKADVIVFDEATSALDSETEGAVMEAIENLSPDLTIVMVAHRLSTLRNCTHIVELAHGCILRIGDYHTIIAAGA